MLRPVMPAWSGSAPRASDMPLGWFRLPGMLQEMKTAGAAICIGLLLAGNGSAAESPGAECPVQGELVHWIADYCMLTLETDDEIAAGDCIDRELTRAAQQDCAAKRHYKTAMCRLVVVRDGVTTVDQCVADRGFAGSTVRNRGVGARQPGAVDDLVPAQPTPR